MITCVVEYVIDPAKTDAFERFARRWMELVDRHGGRHHGYFLPAEGASDKALALFSFPSLAAYEQYRGLFGEHPDFFLFPADEPEATAERVVDLVARRIPRRFGISPRDIQVLAPMHRGPAGAGALNSLLQEAIAPGREGLAERRHGARVFRVGDKVIQIRNNCPVAIAHARVIERPG